MSSNPPRRGRPRRAVAMIGAVAALSLAFAPGAQALQRCANDVDQTVFELEALKTELMVVATTCKGQNEDRYNAFVMRYRPALVESNRRLGQYFTRVHGRSGQRQTDAFVTEMANARSNFARQLGGDYCARNAGLFEEVMALPAVTDLPAYAATKDLLSAGVTACPGGSGAAATTAASSSRSTPSRGR
ncbi:MAG: hypothetical protein K2X74_19835 [Acetobacteraceae bacterium]|nr:hypothetical protein [Acetobacteraceae bacterium]